MAKHIYHCGIHSAFGVVVSGNPEPAWSDDQHHDACGLALAVGILVDDATVTIENVERHLASGEKLEDGILKGAGEIALPAMVSTFCICIVFVPMFSLSGVARYLFVPLAEAVMFAVISSYVLSRTLVRR